MTAPKPPYQRVADLLRARIADGTYPPGSKLPSYMQLAEEFGVSDVVISAAMRELRRYELTETVHGVGVYVRPQEPLGT